MLEKYRGKPVLVPREVYQDLQAAIQCFKKSEAEAEPILRQFRNEVTRREYTTPTVTDTNNPVSDNQRPSVQV